MKQNLKYIAYQLKRTLRHGLQMLLGAIVLAVLAGTIAFCTFREMTSSDTPVSVPVAVVVEEQSEIMNLLLSFLADMKSTADHFIFRVMTDTDAYAALDAGSVAAVMLVPKDLISGIMDGTNLHVQVLLSEKNALAAILLQELSAAGAKTLSSAQAGTYTLTTLYANAGRRDALSDAYLALDMRNLSYALARGDLFHTVHGNATGEESVLIYYACSGVLFFLLLFGICYLSFYKSESDALFAKERSCGLGYPVVITARLSGILFCQLILFLIFGAATVFVSVRRTLSVAECMSMLFLCAGLLLSVGSFFFFLYELIPTPGYAMLFLFLLSILMMLVSGCLIPNAFLPSWCRRVADYLPVTYWMRQLFHLFSYPMRTAYRYPALADRNFFIVTGHTVFFLAGGYLAHIGHRLRRLQH